MCINIYNWTKKSGIPERTIFTETGKKTKQGQQGKNFIVNVSEVCVTMMLLNHGETAVQEHIRHNHTEFLTPTRHEPGHRL